MQDDRTDSLDFNDIDQWIKDSTNDPSSRSIGVPAVTEASFNRLMNHTKHAMGTLVEYKELMMRYNCAIKEIRTKFEVLNTEFKIRYKRNPITGIQTRLKRTSSIAEKLSRMGLPFSMEAIEENIRDVAGVRIICSYVDDIYTLADALLKQDDITLITKKDYIQSPKESGYRSLHLIVEVPVFFAEYKKKVKVEVQIRTIAMDFWASLEHQLKYKQALPKQSDVISRLKACAEVINETDFEMLNIRNEIERMANIQSEEDDLLDRFSRMDMPLE